MKNALILLVAVIFSCLNTKAQETSYRELPMEIRSAGAMLHGTVMLPASEARKLTVCLIISGSGPTDRNGNNPYMKNESLKKFAQALADSGIASLRYDKRGIGESAIPGLSQRNLRFEDYVHDAEAWIDTLKKDPRFNRIVVAGHSEGSLIGMIASQKYVDGFISLSGAGKPASRMLKDKLAANAPAYAVKSRIIIDSLARGLLVKDVPEELYVVFSPDLMPYLISWFKYDPAVEIAKLQIPTLIVQGGSDLQVSVDDADLLSKAHAGSREIIIPEMNHVLKKVKEDRSDNLSSYSNPNRPLHPDLIPPIIDFIRSLK